MDLYSFFNSSASYRVRIALALKGIETNYHGVNIRVGEHNGADFVGHINPSASVPALVDGDFSLGQSLAIIDWLDATYPRTRLIPAAPRLRARVLELSYLIACDIHPVNNLRVLKYLVGPLQVPAEQKDTWYHHWIAEGMAGVERLLTRAAEEFPGHWCFGDAPTVADCCLVPQIANAQRMKCDLAPYPRAMAVFEHASRHTAFIVAGPKRQPDCSA